MRPFEQQIPFWAELSGYMHHLAAKERDRSIPRLVGYDYGCGRRPRFKFAKHKGEVAFTDVREGVQTRSLRT